MKTVNVFENMCMSLKHTFPVHFDIIKHRIVEFYTLSAIYVQHSLQSCVTRKNLHVLVESIVYALKVEIEAFSKI
jgi:hypothetical protein